jgi:hypothetical protein
MRKQTIVWKKTAPKKDGEYLCNMGNYFMMIRYCGGKWNTHWNPDGTLETSRAFPKSDIKEWAEIGRD